MLFYGMIGGCVVMDDCFQRGKKLSRHAVEIATKWCNSLNCGHCAINNTTWPVEGLLFESWNRGKKKKGRKNTLSLITVTGRFLILQAVERADRKSDASLWLRGQPQMSAQCYLSAPSLALWERERASWGLLHRPLHLIRVATCFIQVLKLRIAF